MAELDVRSEKLGCIRIEMDGVFLLRLDVVNKFAIAAGEICYNLVISDQRLKILLAQCFPDLHFLGPIGLAQSEAIERGEIWHSCLLTHQAPRNVTSLCSA